jgi:hypothetical protein
VPPRLTLAACALSSSLVALAGCGGAEQGTREKIVAADHHDRAAPRDDDDDEADDGVEIEGLKGHLDQADIQAGVEPHHGALTDCFMSRVGKRKFLGGSVELSWLIARDGSVKQVQIATADLGAWPIEKCLLEVSRAMAFVEPEGGEAEFSLPLDFPPRGGVTVWEEAKAIAEVEPKLGELAACSGADGDVIVTLYVGTRGLVQSVGFATGVASGAPSYTDAWAECAATAISAWTLSDPLGQVAKLAFRYQP